MYPALAVVKTLNLSAEQMLWVGSIGGVEVDLVDRAGVPIVTAHGGGLHGVGPRQGVVNAFQLARGLGEAIGYVRHFRPDVLFLTGGYVSVPVGLACRLHHKPIVVYLPDIEPGLAIQWLSRLATRVAVTADASRAYFPTGKVVVTGYPVRPELLAAAKKREAARLALGLEGERPALLIFGGSRGARSLNQAVTAALEELLKLCQVIHISGKLDWPRVAARRAELPAELQGRYHTYEYLHEEMGLALAAADLVVSRAGASTLGEFPLFALPSILVPYPYAWRYQKTNADYLVDHGAAVRLDDERLGEDLLPTVRDLLGNPDRLGEMRRCAQSLARPGAAAALADLIRNLGRG